MEGMIVLLIFGLLLAAEPWVSLLAAVVLGGSSLLFLSVVREKMHHYGHLQHKSRAAMIQHVSQGLWSLKEARILGREPYFIDAFVQSAATYSRASRFKSMTDELPRRVAETIAVLGMLLIAGAMLAGGSSLQRVLPSLALFTVAALRLLPSSNSIVSAISQLRFNRAVIEEVLQDLRTLDRPAEQAQQRQRLVDPRAMQLDRAIEVRALHYAYEGGAGEALRAVSLTIPRGAAVAFVGHSGAGKTTLADVLLGLLTPTAGAVAVDGKDIQSDLRAWQHHIGYIPQSVYLCDDSIRRNIAFGREDGEVDDGRVREVLRMAQLEEFVATLPEGLATFVGDRGVRLSGGQRQRIAIARALYHDPPILVMDEATSALDNETERYIIAALEQLKRERTLIIIAHRLTTVRHCDTLFLLHEGKLIGSGSYDELVAASPVFRALVG
jgi:ATP-binding cassette subfamily C protein